MRKFLALVAVAVTVLALALTACGPGQGPAGTVVGKGSRWSSATKTRNYFLTTKDASGRHEFRVAYSDYRSCYRGSAYPRCTKR